MKIIMKKEEALEIIFNALCNGLAYIQGYGLSVSMSDADAKVVTNKYACHCIEDVLINHLRMGNELSFWDDEGEEEVSFDLQQAIKNLQDEGAAKWIMQMLNEEDDAVTADCILQFCLYGEIIFG